MNKLFIFVIVLTVRVGLPCGTVSAQFFRVYGYMTPDANEKELVYWYSLVPSSDHSYEFFGEESGRNGLMAHSLEMEYGITNNLTVAFYADFEQPRNRELRFVRTKAVMANYRFFNKSYLPVDMAVYFEYKLPRKDYENTEEIEFKVILEKDLGFHQLVLNPTFEKKVSGEDVTEGAEFALNGGYYYRKHHAFQPGLEYYLKMGELAELSGFPDQTNYLFPCFDLFFGGHKQFIWHAGIGLGLTDPADNLVVKSILSWGFF